MPAMILILVYFIHLRERLPISAEAIDEIVGWPIRLTCNCINWGVIGGYPKKRIQGV